MSEEFDYKPGDEFPYKVGDEYEGSPTQVTRFMKMVRSAGGTVTVSGDKVTISSLPEVEKKKKFKSVSEVPAEVAEAPKKVAEVPAEVDETEDPTPKKRGRPVKAESADEE